MFLFLARSTSKMCLTLFQKVKKRFQTIKNRNLRKSKNQDFSKGVNPWFWSKIGIFSMFLYLEKSTSKMCLTLFQKVKKRFQTIKNRKLKKVEKSGFFQRGQSMVLVKNLNFFSSFYRRLNRPRKCFCCYSRKEKGVFRL